VGKRQIEKSDETKGHESSIEFKEGIEAKDVEIYARMNYKSWLWARWNSKGNLFEGTQVTIWENGDIRVTETIHNNDGHDMDVKYWITLSDSNGTVLWQNKNSEPFRDCVKEETMRSVSMQDNYIEIKRNFGSFAGSQWRRLHWKTSWLHGCQYS
jgi:hypothetical protein